MQIYNEEHSSFNITFFQSSHITKKLGGKSVLRVTLYTTEYELIVYLVKAIPRLFHYENLNSKISARMTTTPFI